MKRIIYVVLVMAVLAYAASFLPLEFLRPPIESALSRGLGRPVEIGAIHIDLLTGPGVTLEDVTIHEDASAGIEPFAYAASVDARLDLLNLLRGRLSFSSVRFDEASLNLVKPDHGPWNLQTLLNQAGVSSGQPATPANLPSIALPTIKMRGGRVNLKFGDTKAVVYFADSDLDITPRGQKNFAVRFSGVPARTDRNAQSLGHFFVRGTLQMTPSGRQLDLKVELEPTDADGLKTMFVAGGPPLKGSLSAEATLAGPLQNVKLDGVIRIDRGAEWRCKGVLDLLAQTLHLENAPRSAPVKIEVAQLFNQPEGKIALGGVPLQDLLVLGRQLGAPFSASLSAKGAVEGTFGYRSSTGMSANVEVRDALLSAGTPDAGSLQVATATILAKQNRLLAGPFTVLFTAKDQPPETAEAEMAYQSSNAGSEMQFKISTRKLSFAALRILPLEKTDLGALTLLKNVAGGSWRGTLQYAQPLHQPASWSSDYEMQNASVTVEGLSAPVLIQSASVAATPQQVVMTKLRASAADIAFTGDYTWNAAAPSPHNFHLQVAQANAADLEQMFLPALSHADKNETGLLSRTLRMGAGPAAPEWLSARKAEGTIAIQSLRVEGHRVRIDASQLVWAGPKIRLASKSVHLGDAPFSGELRVDLSTAKPGYELEGTLEGLPFKAGRMDLTGRANASGFGRELLSAVRAEGTFRGRALQFSSEAEFRQARGRFSLVPSSNGQNQPEWSLQDMELTQGADTYTGRGSTLSDGKVLLELSGGGRKLRYVGILTPPRT